MGERSSLFDLARQLLQVGDGSILDRPLEELAASMPAGMIRESVDDLVRAGMADTLRDALADDRLDRFAAESCTAREEESLCEMLQHLLGATVGGVGDDDPARLAQVSEPPHDPPSLHAWAVRVGVESMLDEALEGVPHAAPGPSGRPMTLEAAVCAGDEPRSSPLARQGTAARARAQLWLTARRKKAAQVRAACWASPALTPALASLRLRLRALALEPEMEARVVTGFVPAQPVTVDPSTGVAEACLRLSVNAMGADGMGGAQSNDAVVTRVRLFLSGHEQRGLFGDCEACGEGHCEHVRRLSGRLLDGLQMPGDRLHAPLCDVAETPSWRRFVEALRTGGSPGSQADDTDQPRGVMVFRLSPRGAGLSVSALVRSVRRGGTLTAGRVVTLAQAARSRLADDEDRLVLDALRLGSRPLSTTGVPADPLILRALSQHPRVRFDADPRPFRVLETSVVVRFEEQGDGVLPRVTLADVPHQVELPPGDVAYLAHRDDSADALFFAPLTPPVRRLLGAMQSFRGVLPPESFDSLGPWISQLRQVAQVEVPDALAGAMHPVARRLLLRLSDGPGQALQATLSARPLPLGALWPPGHGPKVVHGFVAQQAVHAQRDLPWESETAELLHRHLGLGEHTRLDAFSYRIEGQSSMLALLSAAARHRELVDIEWSERVRKLTITAPLRAENLSVRLFKKGHWLQLEGEVVGGTGKVAVRRLLEAARRGERFVPVEGDTYAEIEQALWEKLQAAQAFGIDLKDAAKLASAAGPALLKHLERFSTAGDEETAAFLARVRGQWAPALPPNTTEGLRGYQREGLLWLLQMASWAPGACLADEMGLGKTVQAIALMRARASLGPALVIAPTSVTHNWAQELARFAPELTVRAYRGRQRKQILGTLAQGHVVVLSYDVLLRDGDVFQGVSIATQIIDEAQWVKNAHTARARAVRRVQADFRLALSGTPVENRLGDLYSLFTLVAPGLLGSWARFRARFAVPIERYNVRDRSEHLRALISPFILRRQKQQVAKELPPRTEVVRRVELSRAERELYEAAVAEARDNLRKRKGPDEQTHTAHVLADLTRLRQLACHPRLVLRRPDAESSKLATFMRILDDLLPRGHRALVFSQFVEHLCLVREALDARGLRYQYLDGSTPAGERATSVQAFQSGNDPLFLISLKAGGTGVNLTAADYVIHLDPWWNPAAEDQAATAPTAWARTAR